MSDNWHDEAANRYRQESADAPFGSIASWNAYHNANAAQQQADFLRADADRAAAAARASAAPSPFPSFDPMPYHPSSTGQAYVSPATPRDTGPPSRFWKFVSVAFFGACALALVALGLLFGARWADRQWQQRSPDGGFARYAVARAMPDLHLQPASAYLSGSGPGKLLGAAALREQLGRPRRSGATQQRLLQASAYACQVNADCRTEVARDALAEASLRRAATDFLLDRVAAGEVTAVDDACFLSLSRSAVVVSPSRARIACFQALSAAQRSKRTPVIERAQADMRLFERDPWLFVAYLLDGDVPLF